MRSPWRNVSRGSRRSRRRIASARWISTVTLPYSTRLTTPLMISLARSLYSSYWRWRSNSRTFWTITCLAVWAAIRPKSIGGSGSSITLPTSSAGSMRLACAKVICEISSSTSSTTVVQRFSEISPVRRSMVARMS